MQDILLQARELYSNVAKRCPQCDFDYVYPVSVSVVKGDHTIDINHNGIQIEKPLEFSRRGVIIVMEWACEEGHQWLENYTFHKGMTHISQKQMAEYHHPHMPPVLWRD